MGYYALLTMLYFLLLYASANGRKEPERKEPFEDTLRCFVKKSAEHCYLHLEHVLHYCSLRYYRNGAFAHARRAVYLGSCWGTTHRWYGDNWVLSKLEDWHWRKSITVTRPTSNAPILRLAMAMATVDKRNA
ncbi:hypothetical protein BDZ89DRAFT_506460 [Hymenopellis radicata]|nr:hypothetical protein BDZ89DRAFT_506460 [Hymenopellis radicata]